MKVIFLDVDGVLNSFPTINEDNSLEGDLIIRLEKIVKATNAKIILSSSWRLSTIALRELMDTLLWYDLSISGCTQDGVSMKYFENTPFENVVPTKRYTNSKNYTYDRGAEIAKWLLEHDSAVEKFIIIDDEDIDIKNWFSAEVVKTNFSTGLTKEDAAKAIKLLS